MANSVLNAYPLLTAQQSTAEVTANGALQSLERLLQLSVVSGITTNNNTPPTTPAAGSAYFTGTSPTTPWNGQASKIAYYIAGGSGTPTPDFFLTPARGLIAEDQVSGRWYRRNGSAWVEIHVLKSGWTMINPTITLPASEVGLFHEDRACTVLKMTAVLRGSSTPSVTWSVRHHTSRDNGSPNNVVTAGTTTTSTSTGSVVTSFNDPTIPANSFVWAVATAVSGTVTAIEGCVYFVIDP